MQFDIFTTCSYNKAFVDSNTAPGATTWRTQWNMKSSLILSLWHHYVKAWLWLTVCRDDRTGYDTSGKRLIQFDIKQNTTIKTTQKHSAVHHVSLPNQAVMDTTWSWKYCQEHGGMCGHQSSASTPNSTDAAL